MSLTDGQAGLSFQTSAPKLANTRLSGDARAAFEGTPEEILSWLLRELTAI